MERLAAGKERTGRIKPVNPLHILAATLGVSTRYVRSVGWKNLSTLSRPARMKLDKRRLRYPEAR